MDSDPYDWNTAQVADFFRNGNAVASISDLPNRTFPDMDALASVFEANGVVGFDLVDGLVDTAFLREECGIKAFAARSTIVQCIKRLSARHGGAQADPAPQTPASLPALPNLPSLVAHSSPEPAPISASQNVRSGEQEITDGRGRKRRKLDLARAAEPPAPLSPGTPEDDGYLPNKAMNVDEMFFGETKLGREVGDLQPDYVETGEWDGSEFWSFQQPKKAPGEIDFAYKQMRYFLQSAEERPLKRRGRDAVAIVPYRTELLPQNRVQSALVFQMPGETHSTSESDPVVFRENLTFLENGADYNNLDQSEQTGEWDFMVEKYKDTEDVLPAFDPESASITSSLDREIAEEQKEAAKEKKRFMDDGEIEQTVQEHIDVTISKWRDHTLPKYEKVRAWTIWKQTRRSKQIRNDLVLQAQSRIAQLDARLDKQLQEFLRGQWTGKESLLEVCQSMDHTIEDREYEKWKIDVWHRKQEPYHEVRRGQTSSSAKGTHQKSAGIAIDPKDRFSVEPAPQAESGADDEYFHTPQSSPVPGTLSDAEDEQTDVDTPMADFIEPDLGTIGAPLTEQTPPPSLGPAISATNSVFSIDSGLSDNANDANATESDSWRSPGSFMRAPTQKSDPPLPSSSTWNPNKVEPIEISSDSTTPSKKSKKTQKQKKLDQKLDEEQFSMNPLDSTVSEIRRWRMDLLIERADRKRILLKCLDQVGAEMRKDLQERMTCLRRPGFVKELKQKLLMLKADLRETGRNKNDNVMIIAARLFLAYCLLRPELQIETTATDIPWERLIHSVSSHTEYAAYLEAILQRLTSKLFVSPKKPPLSAITFAGKISSDSDSEQDTPSKKRKKKLSERMIVQKSQVHQQSALLRQEKFKKALELSNSQDLAMMLPPKSSPGKSSTLVNFAKNEDQPPIFIDDEIATKMKDHQVRGVQFMWRELTAYDEPDGEARGCILAHTMGLGKTMQTITVLLALNEAAQSDDAGVCKQLPKSLRRSRKENRQLRILVLCPAALLENWRNEIDKWARNKLSPVLVADPTNKQLKQGVKDWTRDGGVLIMSYESFQYKIPTEPDDQKPRKATKRKATNNQDPPKRAKRDKDEELAEMLLNGAEVVVADEAHRIKNEGSMISRATKKFKTSTRIALTGTPMSNDVVEIYALISWIHPEYLGDAAWFNARYGNPILKGIGRDSTASEIRRGMVKLALLHRKIEPKIDRANIDVLKGSLTSKVEFHITLPLTPPQRTAYAKFVEALLNGTDIEKASQVAIFQWLALLTLLVNHPLAFKQLLLSPPKNASRRKVKEPSPGNSDVSMTPIPEGEDPEEDEADVGARVLGFGKEVIDDIVAGITDDNDHLLSAKMTILMDIVRLSKACGDKLLIFTHRLGTLDYLDSLFRNTSFSHRRIDGTVPASKRMQVLDEFQQGRYDLLTISTRAGGTGLNIQTANRIIILDAHFNPALEEQAIGRAYRLGQKKPVSVYRLVSGGTFETNIWDKQVFKTGMALRVIDKKKTKRNGDLKSKDYLYPPKDVPQQDVSEYVGRDPQVMDRILATDLSGAGSLIRDIRTTEVLQAEENEQLTEEEQRAVEEEWAMEDLSGKMGKSAAMPPPAAPPRSTAPVGSGYLHSGLPHGHGHGHHVSTAGISPSLVTRLPVPRLSSDMPHGLPSFPSTMPPRGPGDA